MPKGNLVSGVMKLLFFSSDRSEVELVWSALLGAGVYCEVRSGSAAKRTCPTEGGTELWIERDRDYHKASILCAQLGVGFWRHPIRPPGGDSEEGL
jgi:hypothetical protein